MEQYIQSGSASLWTIISGQGALPVLLVNGGPGCDDYLAPVAAELDAMCQVIRFEPRGCGRSSWDGQYDLATTLSDLDQVRRHYNFERVLLVGHSFGPDLALTYLLQNPEHVLGLVGLAGGRIVNDREWHAAYTAAKPKEKVVPFKADKAVNSMGNADYKAYCRQPGLLRDIARIDCPMRYIAGARDIRPNWPIQQLAQLVRDGQYFELPNADHYLWDDSPAFGDCLRAVIRDAYL